MPTLEINGRDIEVDDAFLSMSPEQQSATVDEIAQSLPTEGAHASVPEFQPIGQDGQPLPGYNRETGMMDGPDMGATSTFGSSMAEGVPIIGGALDKGVKGIAAGIGSAVTGEGYGKVYGEMDRMVDRGRSAHPVARMAGNITGGIAAMAPLAATSLGGQVLGITGRSLAARSLASGASNAAIGGADTLARGGSLADAGKTAVMAGGIGAVLPGVGRAISQTGSKAATAAAPTIDAVRQASKDAFKKAFDAGVTLKPEVYTKSLWKMAGDLRKFGYDGDLHPGTRAVLNRLQQAHGQPLDLQELDILRRVASNAGAVDNASDRAAARIVIDHIDDLADDAGAFSIRGGNALGAPGASPSLSPGDALSALKDARAGWHTMRKSETVDELFRRAELTAGTTKGPEYAKALQNEFRSLAKRKNGLRGFTKGEKRAIEMVSKNRVGRGAVVGLAKYVRGLIGTSVSGAAGFAAGGPVGAGIAAAATSGLGYGVERAALGSASRSTINAAQRASAAVRSGGRLQGGNYAPNVAAPLEKALKPAPLLVYDRKG